MARRAESEAASNLRCLAGVRWSGGNGAIKDAVASRDRKPNGDAGTSDPRQVVFPNEVMAVDGAPHVAVT